MTEKHIPVLLHETIDLLKPAPGKNYIDATLGFGGHSKKIIEAIKPGGILIGIDQDEVALKYSSSAFESFGESFKPYLGNFRTIDDAYPEVRVTGGILADIGVSSYQLDDPERGFSFKRAPLDMRMNLDSSLTADTIVNHSSELELAKIIKNYGEEKFAKKIAKAIVEARVASEIVTTDRLVEIVSGAIPRKFWPARISPATKTFQAIRIAVNDELGSLDEFLEKALNRLQPGARLAVITFHSLEDRIVKNFMSKCENPCTCPPDFPKCICGKTKVAKIITKKPVASSEVEKDTNPRSRSAKLRVIEKI